MPTNPNVKKLTLNLRRPAAEKLDETADALGNTTTEMLRRFINLGQQIVEFYEQYPEADDPHFETDKGTVILPIRAIVGIVAPTNSLNQ